MKTVERSPSFVRDIACHVCGCPFTYIGSQIFCACNDHLFQHTAEDAIRTTGIVGVVRDLASVDAGSDTQDEDTKAYADFASGLNLFYRWALGALTVGLLAGLAWTLTR